MESQPLRDQFAVPGGGAMKRGCPIRSRRRTCSFRWRPSDWSCVRWSPRMPKRCTAWSTTLTSRAIWRRCRFPIPGSWRTTGYGQRAELRRRAAPTSWQSPAARANTRRWWASSDCASMHPPASGGSATGSAAASGVTASPPRPPDGWRAGRWPTSTSSGSRPRCHRQSSLGRRAAPIGFRHTGEGTDKFVGARRRASGLAL